MVKWSPKEDVLFSASYDNTIKVWRYDESQEAWGCLNTLSDHTSTVWGIDISDKGDLLVSSSDDNTIIIWSVKSYSNISKAYHLKGINIH
jgi:WD40 repeat protein